MWAIGTGKTATPEIAQATQKVRRAAALDALVDARRTQRRRATWCALPVGQSARPHAQNIDARRTHAHARGRLRRLACVRASVGPTVLRRDLRPTDHADNDATTRRRADDDDANALPNARCGDLEAWRDGRLHGGNVQRHRRDDDLYAVRKARQAIRRRARRRTAAPTALSAGSVSSLRPLTSAATLARSPFCRRVGGGAARVTRRLAGANPRLAPTSNKQHRSAESKRQSRRRSYAFPIAANEKSSQ